MVFLRIINFFYNIYLKIFPPICIHCQNIMPSNKHLFCITCSKKFILNIVFNESTHKQIFDYDDVINTFIISLKKYPSLIKVAASFYVIYYLKLNHSIKNLLVTVDSKDTITILIAKEVAKILNVKFSKHIKQNITTAFIVGLKKNKHFFDRNGFVKNNNCSIIYLTMQ